MSKEDKIEEQDESAMVDPAKGLTPLQNMSRKVEVAEFMLHLL